MTAVDTDPAEIELRLAAALYEQCPSVKPRWESLGETTRQVWIDYVRAGLRPLDLPPPPKEAP